MFEKKRGTRFLASVMALVMLLSLAPVGALAAKDDTQWTKKDTFEIQDVETYYKLSGESHNNFTEARYIWEKDNTVYLAFTVSNGNGNGAGNSFPIQSATASGKSLIVGRTLYEYLQFGSGDPILAEGKNKKDTRWQIATYEESIQSLLNTGNTLTISADTGPGGYNLEGVSYTVENYSTQVTVIYNNNLVDGEITEYTVPESRSVPTGTDVTISKWTQNNGTVEDSAVTATKDGEIYEFKGWSTTPSEPAEGSSLYVAGNNLTVDRNITLYAIWKKQEATPQPNPNPGPSNLVNAKFFINLGGKDASKPDGTGTFTKGGIEIEDAINFDVFDANRKYGYGNNGYIFNENGVKTQHPSLLKNEPTFEEINKKINENLPADKQNSMTVGDGTGREVVWYHVSDCTNMFNNDGYHVDGYITNVAITITYDPNGGSFGEGVSTVDGKHTEEGTTGTPHQIISVVPQKADYTFTGWKLDYRSTLYKSGESITPTGDETLVAQWEKDTLVDPSVDNPEGITKGDGIADKYQIQVSFKAMNGTFKDGKNSITEYTTVVTKYDNSTNKPSENGTAKLAAAHLKTATPNEGHKLTGWTKNNTGCDAPEVGTSVLHNDYFVVTFEEGEKQPIVNPTTTIKYTINQHFMNGKGEKDSDLDKPGTTQSADKDTALSDLIKDLDKDLTIGKDKYMYVSGKYTTKSESQKDQPIESGSKLTEDTTIDLYYYLDNWKDGDSKTPTDKDSETGGDGIPDCYQVLVNYKSGDLDKGKIADTARTQEVLTIKDATGNPVNKGTVKASGSIATVTGNRCYFVNWTKKQEGTTDVSIVAPTANLPKQTIENAKGGDVYTFTANFDRSSGGGSSRPSTPTVTIPDNVPTGLNGTDHYAYIIGYGNNDVRPQNNITRAEVATIFFRLLTDETRTANMTKSNSYNDVKDGDWFCCAVSTLSKMGIIKGYEDGSFKPNAPISRAEFAAIAARFDPDGDKTPATFADVTSHWAKDEISIAANHGWIKGYEDGSFKPDQKITRAETMTLVNRVLNRLPETKDDLHKDMKTWVDNMDETAWYYLAVQEATNSHYFKNKTSTKFEQWTDLRDTRDWSELEK